MKNKNLVWIGVGTALVVGVGLFFLVKANRNKLAKQEWESAGSPVSFEEWKTMSATQKALLLKSKGVQPSKETADEAQKESQDGLKLDTSAFAKNISDLFNKVVPKNQALLEQAKKEATTKKISGGVKKYAQSQFGTQI